MASEQAPETTTEEILAADAAPGLVKLTGRQSRRSFLRKAGVATAVVPAAGGMLVSACYNDPTGAKEETTIPTGGTASASGATSNATTTSSGTTHTTAAAQTTPVSADVMDGHHEDQVKLFLKNLEGPITQGKGLQPLQPTVVDGVKVFNLTLSEIKWETTPGNFESARAYNEQIPGPEIRVTEGDKVRIIVKNNLTESTGVHYHGLIVPNAMDGVPFVTQPPIKPGATFTYEFTVRNSGSHMYHSHHNAAEQTNRGLLGPFIVEPKDAAQRYKVAKEYIMITNDTFLGFTLNGKGFPATSALAAKLGDTILIRYMNEGEMLHPMHLHGIPQKVVAIDGYPLANPYLCDTVNLPPGNRYDVLVECTEPGLWAFHCHVLSHAESSTGMFGLVTVLAIT